MNPDQVQQTLLTLDIPWDEITFGTIRTKELGEPYVERNMCTSDVFHQDGSECGFSSPDRAFNETHLIHCVIFQE